MAERGWDWTFLENPKCRFSAQLWRCGCAGVHGWWICFLEFYPDHGIRANTAKRATLLGPVPCEELDSRENRTRPRDLGLSA